IPLTTVLPEPQTIHVSSSSSHDTAELDTEANMLKKGIAKYGETPNPEAVAQHFFEDKQVPNLKFLEKHLSPNTLNEQTFTYEQTQPEPEHQQQQEPEQQQEHQPIEPENNQPLIEPEIQIPQEQNPQPLTVDDLVIPSEILHQFLKTLTDNSLRVDEPIKVSPPSITPRVLNKIQIKSKTKPETKPKPIYSRPYYYLINSEPDIELIQEQICNDFRNLSAMENDFLIFPSDVSAEAEALKAKFADAVDKLSQIIKKNVENKGMEVVQMMMESVEHSQVKRLTLTSHYDQRIEEEKRKQEEEQKRLKEKDTSDTMMIETFERVIKDKGKAVASEHDPLILMLQEQLALQKAEHELLKEEVKSISESQEHVIKTQDDMNLKLDAILKFMA
ncbi:hypothetical protein A2U01_0016810, partial [Trifolium medium]|nr:hypothetical protein [Trifolium medium]